MAKEKMETANGDQYVLDETGAVVLKSRKKEDEKFDAGHVDPSGRKEQD